MLLAPDSDDRMHPFACDFSVASAVPDVEIKCTLLNELGSIDVQYYYASYPAGFNESLKRKSRCCCCNRNNASFGLQRRLGPRNAVGIDVRTLSFALPCAAFTKGGRGLPGRAQSLSDRNRRRSTTYSRADASKN